MKTKLILGMILAALLIGCRVTPERWKWAEESCKHFGGIKTLISDPLFVRAICNDGTVISK